MIKGPLHLEFYLTSTMNLLHLTGTGTTEQMLVKEWFRQWLAYIPTYISDSRQGANQFYG